MSPSTFESAIRFFLSPWHWLYLGVLGFVAIVQNMSITSAATGQMGSNAQLPLNTQQLLSALDNVRTQVAGAVPANVEEVRMAIDVLRSSLGATLRPGSLAQASNVVPLVVEIAVVIVLLIGFVFASFMGRWLFWVLLSLVFGLVRWLATLYQLLSISASLTSIILLNGFSFCV